MGVPSTSIWTIFSLEAELSSIDLLDCFARRFMLHSDSKVASYGEARLFGDIRKRIVGKVGRPFQIETSQATINCQVMRNHQLQQVVLKGPDISPSDLTGFSFLERAGFVMSWIAATDYDYWQNAQESILFEAAGLDCSMLPRVSNGLPPPLEMEVIDISSNPGRRTMRVGYVEAVGSLMYVSNDFARLTGFDLEAAPSFPTIEAERVLPNVVRLKAADALFTCDEGFSRAQQMKLRQFLYPR
ncbi:MAG: hypothetical protein QM757_12640 [Paludibaculum sp.]